MNAVFPDRADLLPVLSIAGAQHGVVMPARPTGFGIEEEQVADRRPYGGWITAELRDPGVAAVFGKQDGSFVAAHPANLVVDEENVMERVSASLHRGHNLASTARGDGQTGGRMFAPVWAIIGVPMGVNRTGETILHYRLLKKIGEGGMGVVYLAQDSRLGRQVAIKFLAEAIDSEVRSLRRFFSEARTASALNHPNICTVYDIGEHDGRPYIVMELLKGQTLDYRLAAGPLLVDSLLDIGIHVADALDAAHAGGIIHCDIKPANLFLTDRGQVKVLDFGIARPPVDTDLSARPMTTRASSTTDGLEVAGTLPYMSPEQARGEALDARSDIFSFGATLYELATGHRAFAGSSAAVVLDELLNRNPPPAVTFNRTLPRELQSVLEKALEKDPTLRYQHVSELRTDLARIRRDTQLERVRPESGGRQRSQERRMGVLGRTPAWVWATLAVAALLVALIIERQRSGVSETRVRSLAVLPLVNATGDRSLEYLSDGLTVSLINSLADVREFSVKSRASVFRYKGKNESPQAIGRELQVDALLTGTLTRRGDGLRVDVELLDTVSGNQSWGDQFDRRASDIFALEDDIARSVAEELALRLAPDAERRLSRRYTTSIEAYHLYLRGAYHASTFKRDGLNRAIASYKEALALDPRNALAYAGLAHAYLWFTDWYAPSREVSPPALEAARRAVEIDDTLADAHGVLGLITLIYEWDWPLAEREFRRALDLNPKDARTRAYYAWLLAALNRRDEAEAEARRAQESDPLSSEAVTVASLALYLARSNDLAEQFARQVIKSDPAFTWAYVVLGRTVQAKGRSNEAISLLERARSLEPNLSEALAALGNAYSAGARSGEARRVLSQLTRLAGRQYVSPMDFATLHAGLGEREEALSWLERAHAQRSYLMPFIDALPFFDMLDSEPRFQAILLRLKLPDAPKAAATRP